MLHGYVKKVINDVPCTLKVMYSQLMKLLGNAVRRTVVLILHKMGTKKRVDVIFESINLVSPEVYSYETHRHDLENLPYFNHLNQNRKSSIILDPETTIVMQGPVDQKSDFTLRTTLHYLNTYPNARVILSTWENENISAFTKVLNDPNIKSRFTIVQSPSPEYPGISNINMQIVSTNAGIDYARKDPTKYLLKTRTDQCLFSKLALQYMESLVKNYPRQDGSSRILSSSLSTFLLRPYGLSDMVTFGEFQNVSNYWKVKLDERQVSDLPFPEVRTLRNETVNELCEIYLTKRYLESMGIKIEDSLKQSLEAYRDYFLIADNQILDQVWNKYSHRRSKYSRLNSPIRHQELSHFIWRDLQSNLEPYLELESYMDKEGNF